MGAFSWLHLVVLSLMLAVAVAVVVLSVRSWRRRAVNGTIGVTLTISAFYAALMLIIAIGTVVDVLTTPEVTITVPVEQYWPQLPPGAEITDGPTATRVDGGFTSASLGVSGLTTAARVLWAIGLGLDALVQVAIAGLIAVTCFQLLRGAAFARVVSRFAMITAVVVLVGGIAAGVLGDIAGSMASQQLLTWTGAQATHVPPEWGDWDPIGLVPRATLHIGFPFWPIGAGFAFAALAAVFRYGARLQHDTELLV